MTASATAKIKHVDRVRRRCYSLAFAAIISPNLHPLLGNTTHHLFFFNLLGTLERKKMARMGGILICILIVIMDIVAGILGIEAQVAQNKGKHLRVLIFECKEPVHEAYRLGLAAAILLLLAHAVTNLFGGCVCICSTEELSRSSANKQAAAATLLLSWIILAVGFIMLLTGALGNAKSKTSCGLPHRHLLSIGGILCFIHAVFSVAYYAAATATSAEAEGRTTTRDVGAAAPTAPRPQGMQA